MSAFHFDLNHAGFTDNDIPEERRKELETVSMILTDYAQPNSTLSLEETINQTAKFYTDNDNFIPSIHSVLIGLAEQIPYNNPAHSKLAEYFIALGDNKTWFARSRYNDFQNAQMKYYERLRILLWDENIPPDGRFKEGEDPMEFVNLQAFEASFLTVDIMSKGGLNDYITSFFENSMIGAFDQNHSQEPPQVRNAWVMGAAQWILLSNKEIFSLVQKPGDPKIQGMSANFWLWQSKKKKEFIQDLWPYTWEQWQKWKNGFESAARNEQLYDSTSRTLAGQAADLMRMQEKALANGQSEDSPLKPRKR